MLRKTTQRGPFKKIYDFSIDFGISLGPRLASSFIIFLHWIVDAFSKGIVSICFSNWSQNGSQNDHQRLYATSFWPPETLPERLRGAGSIWHRFGVPFRYLFRSIWCRFRHPFCWIGGSPTFKPRKLIRWFLKGCSGYAPRQHWLWAFLLASFFSKTCKSKDFIVKSIL